MKHSHLVAVLAGLAVAAVLAADASAFYHPGLGRWISRDPGASTGDAMRIGAGGQAVGGGFLPRDQYADGMNLYQYVRSSPTGILDSEGLQSESAASCCCREAKLELLIPEPLPAKVGMNELFA